MIKNIIVIVTMLLPLMGYADESRYVNIIYKSGDLKLPDEDHWFIKLFSNQEREVILLTSVVKRNAITNTDTILVPPIVLERFILKDNEIERKKIGDYAITKSSLATEAEELMIKTEFYSIDNNKASSFVSSIKSLSAAYINNATVPGVAEIANSALDALSNVVYSKKTVYSSFLGGIDELKDNSIINLYFDNKGSINSQKRSGSDIEANITFMISTSSDINVDFSRSFSSQQVGSETLSIYMDLASAKGSMKKLMFCKKLKTTLNKKFKNSTTDDLIAIAVNDIEWAQDETYNPCIDKEDALAYKVNKDLNNLINCDKEICLKTKDILLLLKVNASDEDISSFTGGVKIRELDCKFKKLTKFETVRDKSSSNGLTVYVSNSCLKTDSGTSTFENTFTWVNKKLIGHGCTRISNGCT